MNARLALLAPVLLAPAAHAQFALAPASGPPIVHTGTPQGTVTFFVDGVPPTGLNVAMGDLTGDGSADIIVGSFGGHVKVFDGNNHALLASFMAFDNSYAGLTYVATGTLMVRSIPTPAIIVSSDREPEGGGPQIHILDPITGAQLASFYAFPGFHGGVYVATADLDGDGLDDIIAVPDHTHPDPSIKVFSGRTLLEVRNTTLSGNIPPGGSGRDVLVAGLSADTAHPGGMLVCMGDGSVRLLFGDDQGVWRPFGPSYTGGLSIAVGDVNDDGRADVIVGILDGGAAAFLDAQSGQPVAPSIQPYGANFRGGLTVAAAPLRRCPTADYDNDGDAGTDADIEAFFACLAGACCSSCTAGTDFNRDGDIGTDADIEAFFRVLGGGAC